MSRPSACLVCGGLLPASIGRGRPWLTCSDVCRRSRNKSAAVVRHSTPETAASLPAPASPAVVAPPRLPLPIEVRHVPGEWLSNGYPSGIGGRTTYHVGGRSFDTPRAALDFAGR